jgi:hypothetical protein
MFIVSQTAIESVIRDIRIMQETGVIPDYVQSFFASRSEEDEQESEQTDNQQKETQSK